jgi:hypothetical protein
MAAPDHGCTLLLEGGRQPGGLGVVQDDDVARLDPRLQLSKGFLEGLAVDASGRLVQLPSAPGWPWSR